MSVQIEKISKLITKANAVKQYVQKLENEKKALQLKNDELKALLDNEKNTNFELQEELKVLQLAKHLEGDTSGDNIEIKQKINELIKEVDRCIAWLSD